MEYIRRLNNFLEGYCFKKNNFYYFLILIIILNVIIKLMFLGSETLYMDEPYSIFTAQQSLTEIYNQCLHDSNPPLYLFLLHFWIYLFGITAFSAKLFSVLAGVGTAIAVAFFARKFLNFKSVVFASILFLFTNSLLFYSHEARAYSLVVLSVVLSFYLFLSTIKNPTKTKATLLILLNIVLLFLHYTTIFVHVTQFIISLLYIKSNKKGFKYYIISQVFALVLFLPWMKIVIENTPTGETWFQSPSLLGLYYLPANFTNSPVNFIVFSLVIIVSLFALFIKRYKIFNDSFDVKIFYVLLFWYLVPVIFNFVISQYFPVYYLRTLLFSSIGLILLISYIVSCLNINRLALLITSIVLLVIPISDFKLRQTKPEDWNVLVPKVKSIIDDKTIVLVTPWWQNMPFSYYYDVETFKNYGQVGEIYSRKNILFVNDSSNLVNIDFSAFNKIIVVKCRPPQDNIQEFLEKKGLSITGVVDNSDSKAHIYSKITTLYSDSVDDEITINQLIWNRKTLIDRSSGVNSYVYSSKFEKFDSISKPQNLTDLTSHSGKYSCFVNKKYEYGSTLEIKMKHRVGLNVFVSFSANSNERCSSKIIFSVERKGENIEWVSRDITFSKSEAGKWKFINTYFSIYKEIIEEDILKVYIWNPSDNVVYIDDVEIQVK